MSRGTVYGMQGMLVLQFNRENYTSANVNHQPMIVSSLFFLQYYNTRVFFLHSGIISPCSPRS